MALKADQPVELNLLQAFVLYLVDRQMTKEMTKIEGKVLQLRQS